MSALVLPAEVAAAPAPAWATEGLEWERDGVRGFTRSLERPCGEVVRIMQGQSWDPVEGLTVHGLGIVGLDSIQELYSDETGSAAVDARQIAAELLEAARVLDTLA